MILAGDIGGTKTNLALYSAGTERPHAEVSRRFETAAYPNPEALIEDFLKDRNEAVTAACLAVAGPVADGRSRLTNLPWTLVAHDLAHHFGWRRCRLLNDVEATVHALPLLAPAECATLQVGAALSGGNLGVLAPGTGLGVAWALQRKGGLIPIATEAGHSDFAPIDEESVALWRFVTQRDGRASPERILSGPGVQRIYQWRRAEGDTHPDPATGDHIEGSEDPAARISDLALQDSDPVCVKVLECFVRYLGAVAGNLALTAMTRGGIYLAGGIPPKILPKLRDRAFLEAFCDKAPFSDLMATIPVHVVMMESAPILGAAHVAMEDSP